MKRQINEKSVWLIFYFVILIVSMIYAKLMIHPDEMNTSEVLHFPSWAHLFGTDYLGRDYFYQVIMGSVISLCVGFLGTFGLIFVAVCFVLLMNFSKSKFMNVSGSMFLDIFQSLPTFVVNTVLALAFLQIFSNIGLFAQSMVAIVFSISLTMWMNPARLLLAQLNKILNEPFVEGAVALGADQKWIYYRHVLPYFKETFLSLFFIYFPQSILQESILSFIGLGIQSPYSSWGSLMQQGFGSLQTHPHLMIFPAMMIFITMMTFQTLNQKRNHFSPWRKDSTSFEINVKRI